MRRGAEFKAPERLRHPSFDAALKHAVQHAEPGSVIEHHGEDCALLDGGKRCTCVPESLTTGAKA